MKTYVNNTFIYPKITVYQPKVPLSIINGRVEELFDVFLKENRYLLRYLVLNEAANLENWEIGHVS